MPPSQHAVQAQALATIARVRSEVFQTVYNPLNIRNGEKYLRKKLRGPAIMHYYAPELSYRALNAHSPYNAYANWQAPKAHTTKQNAAETEEEKSGQSSVLAQIEAAEKSAGEDQMEPSSSSSSSSSGSAEVATESEGSEAPAMRWRSSGQQLLERDKILGAGFSEVERVPDAGWIDDGAERLRREEVEIRRLMGKGPPKKGQGKRSQMKKKK